MLLRRENAIRLEEKEKREKELLSQIIEEAEQYKVEFYKKREVTCENNKANNRDKEKVPFFLLLKLYANAFTFLEKIVTCPKQNRTERKCSFFFLLIVHELLGAKCGMLSLVGI